MCRYSKRAFCDSRMALDLYLHGIFENGFPRFEMAAPAKKRRGNLEVSITTAVAAEVRRRSIVIHGARV